MSGGFGFVEFDGGHFLKLLHRRKFGYVFEPEAEEEFAGGFVQDGAADNRLAPGGGDQLAGEQRTEDSGGIDPANLIHFRRGYGLFVGDDG